MSARRQARLLLTLSIVLGAHLVAVWLLVSSRQLSVKAKFESLQLAWITRPALPKAAPERGTKPDRAKNSVLRNRIDRTLASPSIAPPSNDENNGIHPAPDWTEELKLAAKDALANELERKRHEFDFAHAFPTPPKRPPQFAWNYAATHRIEALPEGGMLIHLSDSCVLLLFPLPLVGCGIGKQPANGSLFEHMYEK
jgi:hypothetical protein